MRAIIGVIHGLGFPKIRGTISIYRFHVGKSSCQDVEIDRVQRSEDEDTASVSKDILLLTCFLAVLVLSLNRLTPIPQIFNPFYGDPKMVPLILGNPKPSRVGLGALPRSLHRSPFLHTQHKEQRTPKKGQNSTLQSLQFKIHALCRQGLRRRP